MFEGKIITNSFLNLEEDDERDDIDIKDSGQKANALDLTNLEKIFNSK